MSLLVFYFLFSFYWPMKQNCLFLIPVSSTNETENRNLPIWYRCCFWFFLLLFHWEIYKTVWYLIMFLKYIKQKQKTGNEKNSFHFFFLFHLNVTFNIPFTNIWFHEMFLGLATGFLFLLLILFFTVLNSNTKQPLRNAFLFLFYFIKIQCSRLPLQQIMSFDKVILIFVIGFLFLCYYLWFS